MMRRMGMFTALAIGAALVACTGGSGEMVLGNLQDLSGPTSVLGNAVTRGVELGVDRVNARGGIAGKKVKLVTFDTKGDVQEAIKAYTRLADQEKAVAVVGPPVSNIGLAVTPLANGKKVPVIGSFIDPRVTVEAPGKPQPAMFLVQPSSVQYAEIMASYAVEQLHLKKFAIFYDQSNAFSVSLLGPFKSYVQSKGGSIVGEEVYSKGDKDFKTQLSKIKEMGAEALYAPNYMQDLVITLKQKKQVGLDIPVVGGLDFAPPFANLVNDPEAATNCYFANNFSESEPQLVDVKKAYVEKFKEEPINKAYLGYDTVLIVEEAAKKGGGTKPEEILKGLDQVSGLQATTGVITLSPQTHQPKGLSMVMYKIESGKYVDLGRYVPEKHKS